MSEILKTILRTLSDDWAMLIGPSLMATAIIMDKGELREACRKYGIKYSKLSAFQQREALKEKLTQAPLAAAFNQEPATNGPVVLEDKVVELAKEARVHPDVARGYIEEKQAAYTATAEEKTAEQVVTKAITKAKRPMPKKKPSGLSLVQIIETTWPKVGAVASLDKV